MTRCMGEEPVAKTVWKEKPPVMTGASSFVLSVSTLQILLRFLDQF